MTKQEAYKVAVAKDEAFEAALDQAFGQNACNARYMPYWKMPEPAKTACLEYQAACEVLRQAVN